MLNIEKTVKGKNWKHYKGKQKKYRKNIIYSLQINKLITVAK